MSFIITAYRLSFRGLAKDLRLFVSLLYFITEKECVVSFSFILIRFIDGVSSYVLSVYCYYRRAVYGGIM